MRSSDSDRRRSRRCQCGRTIAALYADRWQIETAFQDVAVHLRSEINTLGYPSAALLGFTIGLIAYNLLSVIRRALAEVQAANCQDRKVSIYGGSNEIQRNIIAKAVLGF